MRAIVAFTFVFLAVLVVLASSGCLPAFTTDPSAPAGEPPSGASSDDGGTTDLASNAAGDMAMASGVDLAGPTAAGDLALACDKLQSTAGLSTPSGRHNAGQECQGCHAGGGAPTFTLGGTLYSAASGGAAVAGATINVTDAAGKQVKIISAQNGNFWTTTPLTFPIKVDASLCPATLPMNATVGGNGACNNCHGSTFRVHVP